MSCTWITYTPPVAGHRDDFKHPAGRVGIERHRALVLVRRRRRQDQRHGRIRDHLPGAALADAVLPGRVGEPVDLHEHILSDANVRRKVSSSSAAGVDQLAALLGAYTGAPGFTVAHHESVKVAREGGQWLVRCRVRDLDGATRKVERWGSSRTAEQRALQDSGRCRTSCASVGRAR